MFEKCKKNFLEQKIAFYFLVLNQFSFWFCCFVGSFVFVILFLLLPSLSIAFWFGHREPEKKKKKKKQQKKATLKDVRFRDRSCVKV